MEFLTKAISLIMSLSILVVLHELGHFVPAKLFKTKVEKFYLFFNPWFSIVKKKIGDTVYGIGWLPLGGYVKIAGMIDESMDKEQMAQEPKPWEFRSKPAWQRLIIMIGGVTVNALLAWVIYSMTLFTYGEDRLPNANLPHGIAVDSISAAHGFEDGDVIVALDGTEKKYYKDAFEGLLLDGVTKVTVQRNGENVDLPLPEDFGDQIMDNDIKGFIVPRILAKIDTIPNDTLASAKAGLKKGDQIIAFNGVSAMYSHEINKMVNNAKQEDNEVTILRGADTLTLPLKLHCESGDKYMGVIFEGIEKDLYEHYEFGFIESIPAGFDKSVKILTSYVKQFKKVTSHADKMGGFGSLGKLFPGSFDDPYYWQTFWTMTAFLSIVLAFMNLLPIPALDGGHVMFLLYEIIRGKKPGDKFMEKAQTVGMVLLIGLMLYANGNDLFKGLFGGEDPKPCWEQTVANNVTSKKDNANVVDSASTVSFTDSLSKGSVSNDTTANDSGSQDIP